VFLKHFWQLGALNTVLYVPGAHFSQVPWLINVPGLQAKKQAEAPVELVEPDSHLVHSVDPVSGAIVPAGQDMHFATLPYVE